MKKILNKWDKFRLGHKLHQLQKRWNRAMDNGYGAKAKNYEMRIKEVLQSLKKIK